MDDKTVRAKNVTCLGNLPWLGFWQINNCYVCTVLNWTTMLFSTEIPVYAICIWWMLTYTLWEELKINHDARGIGITITMVPTYCPWDVLNENFYFIYCHLYSAFSIVQCSNALYRLWDGEIQGHTGQPSVREIDAHTMYNQWATTPGRSLNYINMIYIWALINQTWVALNINLYQP